MVKNMYVRDFMKCIVAKICQIFCKDIIWLTHLEQSPKCYANAKFSSAEGSRAVEPRFNFIIFNAINAPGTKSQMLC
ncbi:MAG: hypothetical protein DSZ05_07690 [Sulfurospirillum sp.]|nr:MAG: hypothetical protein DSZ05_07690 [Sulfurospirillum sp.]